MLTLCSLQTGRFHLRAGVVVAIAALSLALGFAPRSLAAEPAQAMAEVLQPFIDSHAVAGAVTLVADNEQVLDLAAVGSADIAAERPMTVDSMFWIASQTKAITAAVLMMLVDEGKVALDDPIEKHLPEFKDLWLKTQSSPEEIVLRRPPRKVTIRDILSHTSGMPFRSALEVPTLDMLFLRDATRSYAITPLEFAPGEKYLYSNCGINTAGRIIEVVADKPYETVMDERLFKPLGMRDTTFWPSQKQLARLATTYKPNPDKTDLEATRISYLRYPLDDHARQPMPGGGLFSTAHDVARFCQMILNQGTFAGRTYLSPAAVAELTKRQTPPALAESYGLGFSVDGSGKSFGHGGALATNMQINPGRNLITIFLVQHQGFPKNGGQAQGAFRKAAEEKYGK